MNSFKGKVAIVTGAGNGIGFEICNQLVHRGANVILNDLDQKLATDAAKKINGQEGRCVPVPGDSADIKNIDLMIDTAVKEFGRLDIAIANAGITSWGEFFSFQPEAFDRLLNVNLKGTFFLAQKSSKYMKENGGGSILMTSSVTGHQACKDLAAYGMTKAAIEMLAKALIIDLSPFNININCVAPGATLTERTKDEVENYDQHWARLTPMGRSAYPNDIANAALFLVSDESRHITGQTIVVDGGWTAVSPS